MSDLIRSLAFSFSPAPSRGLATQPERVDSPPASSPLASFAVWRKRQLQASEAASGHTAANERIFARCAPQTLSQGIVERMICLS